METKGRHGFKFDGTMQSSSLVLDVIEDERNGGSFEKLEKQMIADEEKKNLFYLSHVYLKIDINNEFYTA